MDTITALQNIDFLTVLISVIVILLALKTVVSLLEWCSKKLGIEFSWLRSRKEEHDLLVRTSEDVERLKKEISEMKTEYEENRKNDREQNLSAENKLAESIDRLTDKVDSLTEQSKKYELSDTRDRLLQAHRYYTDIYSNPSLKWTDMESHAFWEQFNTYVSLGGDGYMHTNVEPDMKQLTSIPMTDVDGIANLMKSRYEKAIMKEAGYD